MRLYETIKSIFNRYRIADSCDIDYETAKIIMKNERNVVLVDVRSTQEYKEGHLDRSINIPLYDLEENIGDFNINKDDIVILYCQVRCKK